jgi:hypothetical protein
MHRNGLVNENLESEIAIVFGFCVGFVQPLPEWLKNVIMPLMTKE